ncbi:MAG: FAD-binding oxidoreductase [Nitrolancea sp.]
MVSGWASRTARLDIDEEAIQEFSETLRGTLLKPGNPAYDDARHIWNAMIDRRPAMIARCMGTADVMAAVRFARDHQIRASIKGGGHNVAGNAVCDDGLMIDLSLMKSVRIDPTDRTARVEPGVTWGEFDAEAQTFGLATTGGIVTTTGVAGFTLGGGVGWLNGLHGLACDNLLSADVVTADGSLLHANDRENEDLFWAIRGGGGNFGIVTSFEYQLHPHAQVLGGPVFHPVDRASEVLRFYRDFVANAPDELTAEAGFLTDPDGNRLVGIVVCYAGDISEGERVIEPVRSFGPPIADLIGPIPYTVMQSLFDAGFPNDRQNYWKSRLLPELSDGAIDTIVERASSMPSPLSMTFIHHYHGAYNRVGTTETAYPHRGAHHDVLILANWTDPTESDVHVGWARDLYRALQPHAANNAVLNFMGMDEADDRVRSSYGENYERLVAIKDKYDPTNFFRMNQNVRPSS